MQGTSSLHAVAARAASNGSALTGKCLQEAAAFLKRRAGLEDEYGKGLQKLARSTSAEYAQHEGKAG